MEKLFTYLQNKLKPIINWVDKDKNQLNYSTHPAIGFPAALIKIDYPRIEPVHKQKQKCFCRISIKLVWDFTGTTDSTTDEQLLADNLAYFNTCKQVYQALQADIDTDVFAKPLERTSQTEEHKPDGLHTVNMVFETVVYEGI